MNRVVSELVKVDLHIHSVYSKKDKKEVENNTLDNIPILFQKLEEQQLNMIAITDHNVFNYNLYKTMCDNISDCKTLKKILPGVEFDVTIERNRFHVIAIFDDSDDVKLQLMEKIIENNKFDNYRNNAYMLATLRKILTEIDLNVILIAHQKSGIRVENQNENLAGIGEDAFDQIINYDYFDALEFRSGRIEGILKSYREENNLHNMRYITGTDCHDWTVYPSQNKRDKSDIRFTYIKSLPTFKGLVMAMTEPSRITTAYYDVRNPFLDTIEIDVDKRKFLIELSSGINVIIGDNSIGKSLMLEYLWDSSLSEIDKIRKSGYKNYCNRNKIKIKPIDSQIKIDAKYDRQGNIRSIFQQNKSLNNYDVFNGCFKNLKTESYGVLFDKYIDRVIKKIQNNQQVKIAMAKLNFEMSIPSEIEENNYNLRAINDILYKEKDYSTIIDEFQEIINKLEVLMEEKLLINDDRKFIEDMANKFKSMKRKYTELKFNEHVFGSVSSIINSVFKTFDDKIFKVAQDQENTKKEYTSQSSEFIQRIINFIVIKYKIDEEGILDDFEPIRIEKEDNMINNYHFITNVSMPLIESKDIEKILMFPFSRKDSLIFLEEISSDNFKDNCSETKVREYLSNGKDIFSAYKESVKKYISDEILKLEYAIIHDNDEGITGNSPGKNALIYLDILSESKTNKIYIVDQPGDDVSQNKISSELIDIFKRMSKNKQIIFITHKPELVVNLDVDNVIVLKHEKNGLNIYNGALEYEEKNINILKDVADTLDGGVEVIRKRWKRYDKNDNA